MASYRSSSVLFRMAAVVVILLALTLRLYGRDWDHGWYMQPDERFIVLVLADRVHAPDPHHLGLLLHPRQSPLNPRRDGPDGRPQSFAYGSLPLYVTDASAAVLGALLRRDLNTYTEVGMVGRTLTALVDVLTVALAMVIARRLYGRVASLLTGVLLACSVIMIQLAHFFTVDAWVTLFTAAALLAAIHLRAERTKRVAVPTGLLIGAALATKVSVVALGIPVLLAIGLGARDIPRSRRVRDGGILLLCVAAGALASFMLFEPYAVWQPKPFLNDIAAQWRMANGRDDLPFTRQFVGRIPVRYELGNLIHWGVGPFFGIVALVALVALFHRWRRIDAAELILLSWIIPYFTLIASAQAKYLRYCEPLVPALAVLTAGFLVALVRRSQGTNWLRVASIGLSAVVVLGTLSWAIAFDSIYSQPNTHIAASQWIYQNVPPGSAITAEWWDDSLPLPLPDQPAPRAAYKQITLDLYADRPNQQELDYIAGFLHDSDYIILASDRLSESIPRLPWRYPVASEYYRLLTGGQLGFQLVYESTTEPELGPLRFDDRGADESFTVYDHPHVRIFKKVNDLSRADLDQRFAWAVAQPWSPQRTPPGPSLMLNAPVDQQPVATDMGWSAGWSGSGLVAAGLWLLVITTLGLISLPATLLLFGRFADLGWGLARLLGLLLTGYAVWIGVSLQLFPYRLPWILLAIGLVGAAQWLLFRGRVRDVWKVARARWPLVLTGEVVFLAAFAFFLTLRAMNPDLWQTFWGGEKPFEMSFISAIARSANFPPYDPWYSGGIMNYYYYGYYLVSLLWKLTGIRPEVAFNLAIASVGALLASCTFSLASTMGGDLLRTARRPWLIGAGLTGVLLEGFIGNLDAAKQLLHHPIADFDFWQSSRVVDYAITEFPYFTSIWADLHPHAINLPVTILLLALAYSAFRDGVHRWWLLAVWLILGSLVVTNSWDAPFGLLLTVAAILSSEVRVHGWTPRTVVRAGCWSAASVAGGYLLFKPFFDHFVPLVNGVSRTSNGTAPEQYGIHYGIFLGILASAGCVLLARELTRARMRALAPFVALAAAACLAGFGVASLVIFHLPAHSFLLGVAGTVVLGALLAIVLGLAAELPGPPMLWAAVTPAWALVMGAMMPARPTAGLLLLPLAAGLRLWLDRRGSAASSAAGLFLLGAAGVTLGADLVYVVDDLSGSVWERMNTVFKFYVEGWSLYALAAAMALIWLIRTSGPPTAQRLGAIAGARSARPRSSASGEWTAQAVSRPLLGFSALLLAAGLLYPLVGTGARLAQRMPSSPTSLTLDGLAWMRQGELQSASGQVMEFGGDYDAIQWLRAHATGDDVVLEASIGPYRGNGARISAATGLPDVLGWDRHERQQRYIPGIDQRLGDVRLIYNTTDPALKLDLLRQYRVRYVVVGDVERRWQMPDGSVYARAEGLDAFNQLVGTQLRVAFTSGHTTIYEVIPFPQLPNATRGSGS